jgi:DNA polymerase-3 subunit delta'
VSVFDELVGQSHVVDVLRAAASGDGPAMAGAANRADTMTHAWLFTGPPGSGRSVAARAFAAALQCTADAAAGGPGCGHCAGCHTALAGTHADVEFVRPQGLSLGVREARELVARASLAPAGRRWQILLIEDADRLTEAAANVLLKSIEEPAARTVWLLCVPSAEDLVVTIRSRCRVVALRTPPIDTVASVLRDRDGVPPDVAEFAARAAGGHVGRARRLALDEVARDRRAAVLRLPAALRDVGSCLDAAQQLVSAAAGEADEATAAADEGETAALREAFGEGATATGVGRGGAASGSGSALSRGAGRAAASALKELESRQKSRATRAGRDSLDRALIDLAGFYRDVLIRQIGADVALVNADQSRTVEEFATRSTPEMTMRRLDAVLECRTLLDANANPLLAVESMMLALHHG